MTRITFYSQLSTIITINEESLKRSWISIKLRIHESWIRIPTATKI